MPARRLAPLNSKFGYAPKTGSKILRFAIDFTAAEGLTLELDALNDLLNNDFGTPQAVYIDNSANAGIFKLTTADGVPIYCGTKSVGMFPFPISEKLRAACLHTVALSHVDLWLFNVPQPYFTYAVV